MGERIGEALQIMAEYRGSNPWAERTRLEARKWLTEDTAQSP
jgi:hypothetical protein